VVSVIIPVKNGGEDLVRCLSGIRSQQTADAVEIVVVDSGSTDDSVAVARVHQATVHEIPAHAFSHGASRNRGAGLAQGEILVFVSQDAFPIDAQWLSRLTDPLRDDLQLAGVYGRQLAHDGATPPELYPQLPLRTRPAVSARRPLSG
jgi:glycosyltransferase involved in cell wall biosynthesis